MTKTLYSTSISAAKGLMKRAGSVLFVYILGRSQFVIAMSRMRRRNFQFTGDPDRRGPWTPSGALYTIGGPGFHFPLNVSPLQAIPKSWKPWLLRGHNPLRRPFFLFNGQIYIIVVAKASVNIGGIDMIIAKFYRKRKMERLEEYI